MKAVILAAGLGSRLRPITNDVPKSMVPVNGIPMIDRMISRIVEAGIDDIIVVSGYLHQVLVDHLAACDIPAARSALVIHNERFSDWGNFYSLLVAKDQLKGQSFIKLDGDVVMDNKLLPTLLSQSGELVLAVERSAVLDNTIGDEEMKIACDDNGRVHTLSKQIVPSDAAGESIGIEKVDACISEELFTELHAMIAAGETDDYYERAYQHMIDKGLQCAIADITGCAWCEVDTSEDLEQAAKLAS